MLRAVLHGLVLAFALCWSDTARAATYTVTTLNNTGAGSLRQAIASAGNGDTIEFDPSLSGTITLSSDLPRLNSVTFANGQGIILVRTGTNYVTVFETNGNPLGGDLAMDIRSSATQDSAAGISARSSRDLTVNTLSGSVSATADVDWAYGLQAYNGDITVTTLSGEVSAETGNDWANGLGSNQALTVGELSGSVSVEAGKDWAYGLTSGNDDLTVTTLSGSVSVETGEDSAFGIYSDNGGNVRVGTLSGEVSVKAGDSLAYAIGSSDGDVTVDELSGTVTAETDNISAYGLYGDDGAVTVGELSGTVSVKAGDSLAYGLYSDENEVKVTTLSGSVSATTGNGGAFGLRSDSDLTVNTLSGSVSATTDGSEAYGLRSEEKMTVDDLSGTVSATAHGLAAAVSASEGMDLHVTGTITAEDTSGSGRAYAIAAGYNFFWFGWMPGGNYADTVTLGDGADITGNIDLGGGTNLLTLTGAGTMVGDIDNITALTKSGSGTWSTTGTINADALSVDDGTLRINVTQSAAPTVNITGTATNNAEISFSLDESVTADSFTVLQAGGLAGSGSYTTESLLLTANVDYANNKVDLTKRSFSDLFEDTDPVWEDVAKAIDDNYPTDDDDLGDLISAIEHAPSRDEANAIMEQLTSLLLGQSEDISVGTAQFQSLITQMRMAEMRAYHVARAGGESPDPDNPKTWPTVAGIGDLSNLLHRSPEQGPNGLHLRAVRRTGSMDDHGGQTGYDHQTFLFSGGYDRVLDDHFLAGLSASYGVTATDYNDVGESSFSMESYSLGAYGSWFRDNWYVDAVLSGTLHHYDMKRKLPALGRTAEAAPDGHTLSAKTEGGYRFKAGDWGLTPRASLEYTFFHQDEFTETGAGAANLIVGDTDSGFFESGLGLTVDRTWKTSAGTVIPELSATWLHEWMEQDRDISYSMTGLPATVFSQTMAKSADDMLRVGAGARLLLDKGMTLTARYQGEMEAHARSHSFMFEAQWVF